jgi:two-component system sensor histidine kinase CpxA
MKSIFLKIFLWFWGTVALAGAIFFVMGFHTHTITINPYREDFVYRALNYYSQMALDIKTKEGEVAFNAFLKQVEQGISAHSYIFDNQGQVIYGKALPAIAQKLLKPTTINGEEVRGERDRLTFILVRKTTTDQNVYQFIWEFNFGRPPFNEHSTPRLEYQILRIPIVIIAAGLLCYLLSSYLTSPIVELTNAVEKLANGDLTVRVDDKITARKDEVANLAKNFNLMAERIRYLLEAQKRLIRDISHELRSPLARLNVALLLARRVAGEEATSNLDRIELESERLNEMIGQLLTLARLETAQESIKFENVKLDYLVQELAEDADFEAQASEKAVTITHLEDCEIQGDETLLRRVIENVLRNAIRYTPVKTSVEISLSCQRLKEKSYALITVRDYGEGVPESTLPELFRPFYRVGDSRERESGGTGLGLAIVEQSVKLHNGEIKAINATGGGLKIDIKLPLSQ